MIQLLLVLTTIPLLLPLTASAQQFPATLAGHA